MIVLGSTQLLQWMVHPRAQALSAVAACRPAGRARAPTDCLRSQSDSKSSMNTYMHGLHWHVHVCVCNVYVLASRNAYVNVNNAPVHV